MFAILALLLAPSAFGTEVEVTISDQEVYFGQSVYLEFTVRDAPDSSAPQLPAIPGARIAYVGSSQQLSIANGRRQQSITHRFQMTPERAGTLTIAPFEFRVGDESFRFAGTQVEVIRSETGDLLFVDVVADRDSYYVGEQVRATLEIWVRPYRDKKFNVKLDVDDMRTLFDVNASSWGVFEQRLRDRLNDRLALPGERRQREVGKGAKREYYVYTLQHEFWADQPGTFEIGDLRIVYEYPEELAESRDLFSSFFERGNLRISKSKPLVGEVSNVPIRIKSLPTENRPDTFNGAVGSFDLKVTAKPTDVRVGDPITLTLTIRGHGRLDTLQAPPFDRIPDLSDGFTYPFEPLAGLVRGDAKEFTQTIRAKSADITEIPKLPFSYFDPVVESYQTAWSEPIALNVAKADRLASGAIVEAAGPVATSSPSTSLTEMQEGLVVGYNNVDELLAQQAFVPNVGTAAVVAGPPVIVAGVWLVSRRMHKARTDSAAARRRLARAKAEQLCSRGTASKGSAEVGALLHSYLNDRFALPPGAQTRSEIMAAMTGRKLDKGLISEFDQLLSNIESLQYGGGQGIPAEWCAAIQDSIRKLERQP